MYTPSLLHSSKIGAKIMHNQSPVKPKIQYRRFELPVHFPVIGLLGDSWQSGYNPITSMHFHNCLEIGMLFRGSGMYYIDEDCRHFTAPCVVIAPPNMLHAHYVDPGQTSLWNWLYVDPLQLLPHLPPPILEQLSQYQRSLTVDDCILAECDHPQIVGLFRFILQEMEGQESHYIQTVAGMLQALLLSLMRMKKSGSARAKAFANPHLQAISPAIDYISSHYMQDISVENMARLCHMSTSHFRRTFKRLLGWSPLDYMQMVRIERACIKLYDCEYSVTDIGMQVGFTTPSSFGRQFKKQMGLSPSQWRIKIRSEENPLVTAYFNSVPPSTSAFMPSGSDT